MDLNLHFLDYMSCHAFWATTRSRIKDNEQAVFCVLKKGGEKDGKGMY